MRILKLRLLAFGHFTNVDLEFPADPGRVQLIYGPNEAGKSTVLRALHGLLYGIDARSPDGFLHAYDDLRIGARVRRADGTEFDFIRRKGTRNTFLDSNGKPADETLLENALSPVDEKLFKSLFGIDHERLVAGGREILAGGGDVGQSLFAAGLGGASLRNVLDKLDAEAAELFKPQGKNQKINEGCNQLKEQKEKIAEHSVLGRNYEERAAALEKTREGREGINHALRGLRGETHRLERIARALPHLPAREKLRGELAELGEVPFLPEDFTSQRLKSASALANGREQMATNQERLRKLEELIAALPDPGKFVSQADLITELHQRLGGHRKAARDLPALEAELRTIEKEIAGLLSDLKLDQPETSRLSPGHRRRVQTLAGQHQALTEKVEAATRAGQKLSRRLEAVRKEQQTLPEIAALRDAVSEAQRQGDLEDMREEQRAELVSAETGAREALQRLGLWTGTLDELATHPMPGGETIDRFEKDWQAAENGISQMADRLQEAHGKAAQCEREIDELLRSGAVPTEEELAAARARRQEQWATIRKAWLGKAAERAEPAHLAESYEADVSKADDLADRLRREADRVARHARLVADRALLKRQADERQAERVRQEAALAALQEGWRMQWRPIEPRPPREMQGWLQKCRQLLAQATDLRTRRQSIEMVEKRLVQHRAALTPFLPEAAGQPWRTLISQAQRLVERTDALQRDSRKLAADLQQSEDDRNEAGSALRKWQEDWRDAMREIDREESTKPDEANDFIAECAELQERLNAAGRLRARIKAIHADAAAFEQEAAAAFSRFEPNRPALPAEEAIARLYERLSDANRDATKLMEYRKQRTEAETGWEKAKVTVKAEEVRLAEMCRHAGGTEAGEFEAIEKKSREAQEKRTKLGQLEEQIQMGSGGAPLEEFIAEIGALDGDAVTAQIAEKQRQISEADEQRSTIDKQFGAEEAALKAVDGNARAAEAAELSQAVLGQIEEHTERFIRLRLAAAILRREIERYRAENQDPLLKRTGELFRTLTLESFGAITTDFGVGDNLVLKGQRPSGQLVRVEGMSEGTRDQLFLALHLASVEKFLAAHGPMPFIVDDVLIGFDHEREAAVLRVLAELAEKTQVMIFTHHRHLVELAERTLGERVDVHRLGSCASGEGDSTSNIQHPTPNIQSGGAGTKSNQ